MSRLLRAWLLAVAVGAPSAAGASAPEPGPDERVERARLCVEVVDYECAEAELEAARADAGALDEGDLATLHRLSAEVALAQGRRAAAVGHLIDLLTAQPRFEPPAGAWPAAWQEALAEARRRAPDRLPPELAVVLTPSPARPGDAVAVEVRAVDPSGIRRVTLFVAPDGADEPLTFALVTADAETWRGTLPAELVRAPGLDLWVEAWDRLDNGPGRWGDPASPRTLSVEEPPEVDDGPITERWWFWTAIGAGVAAGVVAIVLATSGGDGGERSASLGALRIVPELPP